MTLGRTEGRFLMTACHTLVSDWTMRYDLLYQLKLSINLTQSNLAV